MGDNDHLFLLIAIIVIPRQLFDVFDYLIESSLISFFCLLIGETLFLGFETGKMISFFVIILFAVGRIVAFAETLIEILRKRREIRYLTRKLEKWGNTGLWK